MAPRTRTCRHRAAAWAAMLAVVVLAGVSCSSGGDTASDVDLGTEVDGRRPINFVGAGSARLGGILSLPDTVGPDGVGAVLFVPMPGAGDIDGPIAPSGVPDRIFADLSAAMVDAGLATFRYDRRGTGLSVLDDPAPARLEDMVEDVRAAVQLLVDRAEVDPDRIAVVGYGEAGLVAMQAVADAPVSRLVLVSSPGRPLVEVVASSLAAQVGEESAEAFRGLVAGLLAGEGLPALDAMSNEHRVLLPTDQEALLRELYGLAPLELARQVTVPTLVVASSNSDGADVGDAERLARALGGPVDTVATELAGPTLALVTESPVLNPNDPASGIIHEHGTERIRTRPGARDDEAVAGIVTWLGG